MADLKIPLDEMTIDEKLDAMETLWRDLSKDPSNIPSPDWHGAELADRAGSIERGDETVEDWKSAKARIKKETR